MSCTSSTQQGQDDENIKPTKRVTISEDVTRKRHTSGDVVYTDDEVLSMAKEDLVGLLGLDVSLLRKTRRKVLILIATEVFYSVMLLEGNHE